MTVIESAIDVLTVFPEYVMFAVIFTTIGAEITILRSAVQITEANPTASVKAVVVAVPVSKNCPSSQK